MDLPVSLCRRLTRSANLRVASTSVRSQPFFNVIVSTPQLQVTLLVQKGVGTRYHPTTPLGRETLSLVGGRPHSLWVTDFIAGGRETVLFVGDRIAGRIDIRYSRRGNDVDHI